MRAHTHTHPRKHRLAAHAEIKFCSRLMGKFTSLSSLPFPPLMLAAFGPRNGVITRALITVKGRHETTFKKTRTKTWQVLKNSSKRQMTDTHTHTHALAISFRLKSFYINIYISPYTHIHTYVCVYVKLCMCAHALVLYGHVHVCVCVRVCRNWQPAPRRWHHAATAETAKRQTPFAVAKCPP